jgi:hypothetical protein
MDNTWYLSLQSLFDDLKIDPNLSRSEQMKKVSPVEPKNYCKKIGKFTVKYTNYNYHQYLYRPYPKRSIENKMHYNHLLPANHQAKIQFFEDDVLIKELDQLFENPCIILGGNGQTRKETKFTLLTWNYLSCNREHVENNQWIEVYDFEFNLIRKTLYLPLEDLFETNHDYFLTIADIFVNDAHESPHLGIVKKSDFFADDGNQKRVFPYDNSRVGLPTDDFGDSLYPAKVTKDKMILNNGQELNYDAVEKFDFDPENKIQEAEANIFKMFGFPADLLTKINQDPMINEEIIKNGCFFCPLTFNQT